MPLSHRSFGAARIVAPGGRLDHESCEAFQADLGAQVDACTHEGSALVLDLSQLEYVSSAGLRCLMIAARQAGARSGRIVLASPQPVVAEILQISRFDLVLPVFATTREALTAVAPQSVPAFDKG